MTATTSHRVGTAVVEAVVIYDAAYSLEAVESATLARANTKVRFFPISLATVYPQDVLELVRAHDFKLTSRGQRLTAIVVATGKPKVQRYLLMNLRHFMSGAAIMTAKTLRVQPIGSPPQSQPPLQSAIDDRLKELEGRINQINTIQKAQSEVLQATASEVDDIRDDSRVTREDIYNRLGESSQMIREVTGGNLGPVSSMPTPLTPPEPEKPWWRKNLRKTAKVTVGALSLIGGGLFWAASTLLPEFMPDAIEVFQESAAERITAPAETVP